MCKDSLRLGFTKRDMFPRKVWFPPVVTLDQCTIRNGMMTLTGPLGKTV
jgi:hypothetical protein